MADKVRYAISVTPIEELTSAETGSETYDVLSSVTGKSLGGSNSLDLSGGIEGSLGYDGGTVAYLEVTNGGSDVLNANADERRLIFVKNTGYEFNSATVLGDAITKKFTVTMGSELIAQLGAGDVMVLPNAGGGANNCKTSEILLTAEDGTSIACEFLAVTL